MRASASAGASAPFPIGVIGEQADLTYAYDYLGAGPDTLARARCRQAQLRRGAEERRASARARRRRARWRGHDGARGAGARGQARASSRRGEGRLERLRVLHTAASRVGALDIGFVPGEGGLTRSADGDSRRRSTCCSCSAPTRSTSPAGAFVVYIGTHGDARRASRRRDPAGRRLHREIRHLRQHRRPRADGRTAPPSRRARRARTGRSCARCPTCSARRCLTTRWRALRQALFKAHPHLMRIDQIEPGDAADIRRPRRAAAAALDKTPFRARSRTSI